MPIYVPDSSNVEREVYNIYQTDESNVQREIREVWQTDKSEVNRLVFRNRINLKLSPAMDMETAEMFRLLILHLNLRRLSSKLDIRKTKILIIYTIRQ